MSVRDLEDPNDLRVPLSGADALKSKDKQRIAQASAAYKCKDAEKSRQAHQRASNAIAVSSTDTGLPTYIQAPPHNEPDSYEGVYIKPMVFGGLDGVGTSFALMAGSFGTNMEFANTMAICAATILASAMSMGVGEYISSKAEREIALREKAREHWEVEVYPEGEVSEMVDIYIRKGIEQSDAQTVARILSKYRDFWVEHMMLHELNIIPPEDEGGLEGVKQALVMFFSFAIFGSLPVIVYACLIVIAQIPQAFSFALSCGVSFATLFMLGGIKSYIAETSLAKGGLVMGVQGIACGGVAYWIGSLVQNYELH